MMDALLSVSLEGFGGLLVVFSLVFLCLKIKSTKKNPEFLGVAGTLVHKNPDEEQAGRKLPDPPPAPVSVKGTPLEEEDAEDEENNNKGWKDVLDGGGEEEEEDGGDGERGESKREELEKSPCCMVDSEHPYAKLGNASRDGSEHPYARLETRLKHGEHEYATLQESFESSSPTPSSSSPKNQDVLHGRPTYMTVSEATSEDTYAAIEDPLGTYAIILDENHKGEDKRLPVDESGYTLVNKSKKKEEKHQENKQELYAQVNKQTGSSVDESGYSRVEKFSKRPQSCSLLEDMYAKVNKKHEIDNESSPPPPRPPSRPKSRADLSNEIVMRTQRVGPRYEPMEEDENSDGYEILREKKEIELSRKDSANYEILPDRRFSVNLRRHDSSVGYETVPLELPSNDAWKYGDYDKIGYESVSSPYETLAQNYFPSDNLVSVENEIRQEPLGKSDPPYAELMKSEEEEGYETIPRINDIQSAKSNIEYDPAYEIVTKAFSEPAYETIESKSQITPFEDGDSYEGEEEGPSSLIYMSVQESNHSSPESNRRASVVVIERVDVTENVDNEDNNINEINTHIFV
ncbi:uncharacterized protein [Lepeophtheirus salmonis]|uniref:uncharacterized protein n=1 Tax=Lepeophtheirus salmonis TaxID=72036 RepID=UPI001AE54654|nr:uncharacterized protein LOC121119576 [Lepeophtheirus salmonis]